MSFANDILDAIEIIVKQVVEDNVTKIYTGVCKTIGVNSCVLTINGKDNTVKYYGGVPVVGTVYQVFIPFGNMSAAFIIVPGSGGGSGGSGVDSVNGKTGNVVLNAADVGLGNVDNIKQYSENNPPPYPVTSVNGKTGKVNLVASDVGAVSTDNITQTLGTSTTKVPSEKAVSDAMGAAGGGSAGIEIDDTLTVSGKAADAAAVGDALSTLSEEIANIPTGGAPVSDLKSILTNIITFLKAVPFDDTVASASDLDAIQSKIDALGSGGGSEEPTETVSATFSDGALAIIGVTVNSATFTDGVLAVG